jgi:hypothetical protein
MPRYFMHLRDGTDEILDPEGVELSAEAVAPAALAAARDCIAGDVRRGVVELGCWIDVHDERDAIVHSLHFVDAVTIHSPSDKGAQ